MLNYHTRMQGQSRNVSIFGMAQRSAANTPTQTQAQRHGAQNTAKANVICTAGELVANASTGVL